eukprot:TRINITY_DN16911_c0_g3_i1.p1 TRINITY_DN16911_c0_g3~~TRINITY_DN16911_c0_g3_i1.p1  ORF type:complete len:329 (+),score=47.53 TRINITY_DN16911_c0_g3_i1:25-1011(+)
MCYASTLSPLLFFFLIMRPPQRSTLSSSSAASDVYKRQAETLNAKYGVPKREYYLANNMDPSWEKKKLKRVEITGSYDPLVSGIDLGDCRRFAPGTKEREQLYADATGIYCFASQELIALKFNCSQSLISLELTRRRKDQGLLPIITKKVVPIVKEKNLPRVLDMHLGFLAWEKKVKKHGDVIAYQDETPLRWGAGNHAQSGRCEAGDQVMVEQPVKFNSATATLCITRTEIIKAAVQRGGSKGDQTHRFMCLGQPPTRVAPNLGGPPVFHTLTTHHPDVKYVAFDMYGRAGRAHHPQKGHFHPEIAPKFAKQGLRLVYLPPKGSLLS